MHNSTREQANTTTTKPSIRVHSITQNDLPLCCPLPSASQWNAHPRVFLRLDEEGRATCPYCSMVYVLQQED
ncbi:MAG: zinc-finger domain-containing protein [Gammaproteobacteria bacterium]|nr:zinc-finger domain-containing protein [Gammaproteobacteria bacterium]